MQSLHLQEKIKCTDVNRVFYKINSKTKFLLTPQVKILIKFLMTIAIILESYIYKQLLKN